MTAARSPSIRYIATIRQRAERAVRCAPFQYKLYAIMIPQSVSIKAISGTQGRSNSYTSRTLSELGAETELLWLMQVGLLRREVDGQGLTDSFRITPLGRQLVEGWQDRSTRSGLPPTIGQATLRDRLYNAVSRWIRLPF
jgi:hypothetical protein